MKKHGKYYCLLVIAIFFVVAINSCMLLHRTTDLFITGPPKALLYYKITGLKIQLLEEDSVFSNTIILTEGKVLNEKNFYFKLNFEWKPDKDAGVSPSPGFSSFSNCSKRKITKLDIIIAKPDGVKESLTKELIQPDSTKDYKLGPALKKVEASFLDIDDVVNKVNTCHPKGNLWSSTWSGVNSWCGIVFICKSNPIAEKGIYNISAEVKFSDSTTLKNEINLKGEVH